MIIKCDTGADRYLNLDTMAVTAEVKAEQTFPGSAGYMENESLSLSLK